MTPAKAQEIVRRAYQSVLKREPDAGSAGFVEKVLREGWMQPDVERELRKSDEYHNKRREPLWARMRRPKEIRSWLRNSLAGERLKLRTVVHWTPLSREELQGTIERGLAECSDEQRADFRTVAFEPAKWEQSPGRR